MERKRKEREREGRRRIVKSYHQFSLIIKKIKLIEVTPDNTVVQAWALQPDCLNLSHDLMT